MQPTKRGSLVLAGLALSCALSVDVVSARKVQLYKLPPARDFPAILSKLPADMNKDWLSVNYDSAAWQVDETIDKWDLFCWPSPEGNFVLKLNAAGMNVNFWNENGSWMAKIECRFKGSDHTKADCVMSLDDTSDGASGYGEAVEKADVSLTPFEVEAEDLSTNDTD